MLNGWKAIGAYLKRDERTAMRWAADRGLPVHRAAGPGRGVVYALPAEIDAWLVTDRTRWAEARITPAKTESAEQVLPVSRRKLGVGWLGAICLGGLLVALAVAVLLRQPEPLAGETPRSFADPEARALYFQASYDWNRRTPDSLQRAIQEYSAAIGHDPRVSQSYVGLANSYLLLREFGTMPDADAYPRAEAAAQAAVDLEPRSAAAHRALAFVAFWWRQNRPTAKIEFGQAISLKPDDPLTHHWFATALAANGEPIAALTEIRRARDLDPAATAIAADQGLLTYLAGRRSEGIKLLRAMAHDQPDVASPHRYLAFIALWENRPSDYLVERAATARLRGDLADAAEVSRLRDHARTQVLLIEALLRKAEAATGHGGGWFAVAQFASLAGRRQLAETALARACKAREPATIAANGDLWLSRAVPANRIASLCGYAPIN